METRQMLNQTVIIRNALYSHVGCEHSSDCGEEHARLHWEHT